jgi:pyruvate dehydrogenase E1 component beta subunit
MDFITLAVDQLVNQAAKLRYVFGKQARCPIVVRTPAGGGRCYGPTHSQSLEAWFVHVPGLKVAAPATPADAKGLLLTAIRDDNPVLFIEHKMLYNVKGDVPLRAARPVPFGKARRAKPGADATVVAWSWMAHRSEEAARELAADGGPDAEVLDLRTLNPLDADAVVESVRRTRRLLIVEENWRTGGVGAEIASRVCERAYGDLEAPVRRLATLDVPLAASPELERAALPDKDRIRNVIVELVDSKGRP